MGKHISSLSWIHAHLPKHIEHPFSQQMSEKSQVHSLPVQFQNETCHEDCISIMDCYEKTLSELYSEAFGKET